MTISSTTIFATYPTLLIATLFIFLYLYLLFITPPHGAAFDNLIIGKIKIIDFEVKNIVLQSDHDIVITNEAFKKGYFGDHKHIQPPFGAYHGRIKTSNSIWLNLHLRISTAKASKIGLLFMDLEDTSYIIDLPDEIISRIYDS